MKGFIAGVIFTLVSESAIAILANKIKEEIDEKWIILLK